VTGKETAILVRQWQSRLDREIDLLRLDLERQERQGVEVYRSEPTRVYQGPKGILGTGPANKAAADAAENWKEEPGEFRVLQGLLDLAGDLDYAIDSLEGSDS
jgi:hypothetical protein